MTVVKRLSWNSDRSDYQATHIIGFTQCKQAFQLSPHMDMNTPRGGRVIRVKCFGKELLSETPHPKGTESPIKTMLRWPEELAVCLPRRNPNASNDKKKPP